MGETSAGFGQPSGRQCPGGGDPGRIHAMLGQHEEAAAAFREAINLQEQLVADLPDLPEHQRELAASYQGLAGQLADMAHYTEADQNYGQAVALAEPLALEFPEEP